jgi:hypothetical protein
LVASDDDSDDRDDGAGGKTGGRGAAFAQKETYDDGDVTSALGDTQR